jgi:hypothetical protein
VTHTIICLRHPQWAVLIKDDRDARQERFVASSNARMEFGNRNAFLRSLCKSYLGSAVLALSTGPEFFFSTGSCAVFLAWLMSLGTNEEILRIWFCSSC